MYTEMFRIVKYEMENSENKCILRNYDGSGRGYTMFRAENDPDQRFVDCLFDDLPTAMRKFNKLVAFEIKTGGRDKLVMEITANEGLSYVIFDVAWGQLQTKIDEMIKI